MTRRRVFGPLVGVLLVATTGEVILEPRDRSAEQLAKACKALTGA